MPGTQVPRKQPLSYLLSLFHMGDGVCSLSLQPEHFRQWRPITLHVEQFGSDFTLPGHTKAVPGELVLLEHGCGC